MNRRTKSDHPISDALFQFIYPNLVEPEVYRDYQKEYEELIQQARLDEMFGGREKVAFEYKYESHHIIPRCLGGSDNPDNLVNLTLAEHFEAHFLLFKLYHTEGLTFAYRMMYGDRTQSYEEAKENFCERRYMEY
jgi:hypothetical protein